MIFAMVENNVNMDKFQKHAVIKYLFLKGMSGKAIHDGMLATLGHDDILATLGDNAPVYSVVKIWLVSSNVGETVSRISIVQDAPKTQQVPKMLKLRMTC